MFIKTNEEESLINNEHTCAGFNNNRKARNSLTPSLLPLFGFAITSVGSHFSNGGVFTSLMTTLLRPTQNRKDFTVCNKLLVEFECIQKVMLNILIF